MREEDRMVPVDHKRSHDFVTYRRFVSVPLPKTISNVFLKDFTRLRRPSIKENKEGKAPTLRR